MLLALVWLATTATTAAGEAPEVFFNPKVFFDDGNIVHVEDTVTGEGIG